MPAQFTSGGWMIVARAIELFTAMGCEVRELKSHVADAVGLETDRVLFNRETDGLASLVGLDDDDRVPPAQIDEWERLLGVAIPRGDTR